MVAASIMSTFLYVLCVISVLIGTLIGEAPRLALPHCELKRSCGADRIEFKSEFLMRSRSRDLDFNRGTRVQRS